MTKSVYKIMGCLNFLFGTSLLFTQGSCNNRNKINHLTGVMHYSNNPNHRDLE